MDVDIARILSSHIGHIGHYPRYNDIYNGIQFNSTRSKAQSNLHQ